MLAATNTYTGHLHPAVFTIMVAFDLLFAYIAILGLRCDYGALPKKLMPVAFSWFGVLTYNIFWYGWWKP